MAAIPKICADPSRQRGDVEPGRYLSLAIAKAHGGTLEIGTAPGQGTRVRVGIPLPAEG